MTSSTPRRKPTAEEAHAVGAKGGLPTDHERALFDACCVGYGWGAPIWDADKGCYTDLYSRMTFAAWRDRAALDRAIGDAYRPTIAQARARGKRPAYLVDAERVLFEAWMRGHCWATGDWQEAERSYTNGMAQAVLQWWLNRASLTVRHPTGLRRRIHLG